MWRPLAAFNGIDDPLRLRLGSSVLLPAVEDLVARCDVAEAQISNAFTVSIDGKPLPADLVPLLVSADVDDSLNLPDLVILRFRDAGRTVLAKSNIKIGAKLVVAGDEQGLDHAGAADHRRGHCAGGGVRRHRHVHRRPRVRPRAPALPRPAHRDLHRRSRRPTWRRRSPSGPGSHWARSTRRPRCSTTSARPGSPTGSSSTDWPGRSGTRWRSRTASSSSARRSRRRTRPHRRVTRRNPLLLRQGSDLVRFRAVVTSAEQVKEVQVRGWDVAQQEGARRHRPREDRVRAALRPGRRSAGAGQDVRRSRVRRHRRALPRAVRGRRRGEGALGADRGRVRRVRGHRPRQPEDPRRNRDRDRQPRGTVRRQVRGHLLAAQLRPDHRLHARTLPSPAARNGRCSGSPPVPARVGR